MSNRLAAERSPYLLQHAHNPVDWYPWGDEAFTRARREEKPIFLSIGYSTCHWCHVMERESFESADVAKVLNEHFVPIKVDREERPDVDRVYMTFVQATTGSGGWPMSVWLTPDLKPFFGGTYFPPTSRWGRPGFVEILTEIARVWQGDRVKVLASAETLMERLRGAIASDATVSASADVSASVPDEAALASAVEEYSRSFDPQRGGFGSAPKFPRPSELFFLLREWRRTGREPAREMALTTLRAMALGGMRDHIGGGFHRYSVDADWRVPHFEKMLYDQAQLTLAFLEAAQASGEAFYASVAEDTIQYVLRDLTDARGGFYSAEDADSIPPEVKGHTAAHKTEGAFYVWTDTEIGELLGVDAEVARLRFGIVPEGNAPNDPQGEFRGKNIPYVQRSVQELADRTGRKPEEVMAALARIRPKLFAARVERPRPHLDDKILTAWNGLMIAALARASRVLVPGGERALGSLRTGAYLDAARRAATFVREVLWNEQTGVLLRRYRDGEAAIHGYAEDYAMLTWGLLELFQADGDPAWLEWAARVQSRQDELFWDPVAGGWFNTTGEDPSVLLRLKEDYDGAEPSASAIGVMNLIALAHLTGDGAAGDKVEQTLGRLGSRNGAYARSVPMIMAGVSTYRAGLREIVLVGAPHREDTQRLRAIIADRYLPFAVVVPVDPTSGNAAVGRLLPFTAAMSMRDDRATAYICRDFTCQQPTAEPDQVRDELERT